MNRTLSNVLLFTAGVAVGSVVTWKIFKSKYEIIDGEYEDIYAEDDDEGEPEEQSEEDRENEEYEAYLKATERTWANKPPLREYAKRVQDLGYNAVAATREEEDDGTDEGEGPFEPYVIHPDQYGEIHDYDTVTLYYYADGVLADELDNRIEDAEGMVGTDFVNHYGEYEDDSVWIRNDERQCDYEILRDKQNFSDVIGTDPHPSEDE